MAPIFVSKLPLLNNLNYPLDGYRRLYGKRILGDHKTWRGLFAGVIVGGIVGWLEWDLLREIIGFSYINPLLWGCMLGLGALVGDGVKSFFKRQLNIKSGQTWFPFDQIDYIVGGILFSLPVIIFPWYFYAAILIIYFVLHLLISFVGFLLKLKDAPI